jgi:hypothetical protein
MVGLRAPRAARRRWRWGSAVPWGGQGPFSALPPGVALRLDGHAVRSAIRDEVAKRRGAACGQMFTAGGPGGVGVEQDSAQARAVRAVRRYALGGPGYRWQASQARLGLPGPEAPHWAPSAAVGDGAYKGWAPLEREAAQGEGLWPDATAGRMRSWRNDNRARTAAAQAQGVGTPTERPGRPTTACVIPGGAHTAMLSYASRQPAGATRQRLRDKGAPGLAQARARSAALASHALANAAAGLRWHGLAPGRRQLSALGAGVPHACPVGLEVLRQVCAPDAQARTAPVRPEARGAAPQAQRQPVMDALKPWLARPRDARLVAPTSSWGKAIASRQHPWATLPRF